MKIRGRGSRRKGAGKWKATKYRDIKSKNLPSDKAVLRVRGEKVKVTYLHVAGRWAARL